MDICVKMLFNNIFFIFIRLSKESSYILITWFPTHFQLQNPDLLISKFIYNKIDYVLFIFSLLHHSIHSKTMLKIKVFDTTTDKHGYTKYLFIRGVWCAFARYCYVCLNLELCIFVYRHLNLPQP